jgi:hypothetical protein
MNILVAIKREEKKAGEAVTQVTGSVGRCAYCSESFGTLAEREVITVKKRVLSEAGRAKIAAAARKRWAKVRKQAKEAVA